MRWKDEELGAKFYIALAIFFSALLLLVGVLSGNQYDKGLSSEFTRILQKELQTYDIEGRVHFDARGSVDFWVTKAGEFHLVDFAVSIGAVAGYALGAGKEFADRMDTLYFKREVDRFSVGEITAKECLLIYTLMTRGGLSDAELEGVIMDTIKWTKTKR